MTERLTDAELAFLTVAATDESAANVNVVRKLLAEIRTLREERDEAARVITLLSTKHIEVESQLTADRDEAREAARWLLLNSPSHLSTATDKWPWLKGNP